MIYETSKPMNKASKQELILLLQGTSENLEKLMKKHEELKSKINLSLSDEQKMAVEEQVEEYKRKDLIDCLSNIIYKYHFNELETKQVLSIFLREVTND